MCGINNICIYIYIYLYILFYYEPMYVERQWLRRVFYITAVVGRAFVIFAVAVTTLPSSIVNRES